jgi:ankyrin repeat protein
VRSDLVGLSQEVLNAKLWDASWANNVTEAEQLIYAGADVNAKDSTMQSAYLVATSEGYLDMLNLTLSKGADVTSLDSYNGTGLIRAAERGHAAVVGRLIQAGISLDHINYPGYVALHEALIYAKPDQVEAYQDTVWVLVAAGSNLSIPVSGTGESSLSLAERYGLSRQAEIIRRAIAAPLAPAEAQQQLLQAARTGDPDLAALALRAGAPATMRDQNGTTALSLATTGGHEVTARLLTNLGATK